MSGYEQYQLGDLQNLLLKYGSKRFDPHGSNPWTYFAVLLLSLQFERVCRCIATPQHPSHILVES